MPHRKLEDLANKVNIAKGLSDSELHAISQEVLEGFTLDNESMEEWLEKADTAMDLAGLKKEPKNWPWRKAANIKYPLIATAVTQFTARALPEMIKNGKVAKPKVMGRDPQGLKLRKGERISAHLNYQVMEQMGNWLDERDKLHSQLAVVGTAFTKTWWDPIDGQAKSELVPYDCIIVNNQIKYLEDAPRISQFIYKTSNEIIEHIRFGLYRKVDIETLSLDETDFGAIAHELLEQHTWLDLDEDGYKEPYTVVLHKASGEVLRIVARYTTDGVQYNNNNQVMKITPQTFFTDYHFLPSPDGSFLSHGFGTLLLDINETTDTLFNQLLNAGTLTTTQGGLISSGVRMKKHTMELEPGEWKFVEVPDGSALKDNLFPLDYKEPSVVLFNLLSFLLESAKDLTSTVDAITGNTGDLTNVSPNTIMALQKEGLKVYTAIQRRIQRGFKKELKKLVLLNSIFLDVEEYIRLLDPSPQELMEMLDAEGNLVDYQLESLDIVPIVDENMSTSLERMLKAQATANLALQFAQTGAPNMKEVWRRVLVSLEQEDIDALIAPEQQGPDPQVLMMQAQMDKVIKELELKEREVKIKEQEAGLEALRTQANVRKTEADVAKNATDARAKMAKISLDASKEDFKRISELADRQSDLINQEADRQSKERIRNVESGQESTDTNR